MGSAIINQQYLTDTANAIRNKLNVTNSYYPSQFAGAINSIEGGSSDPEDDDILFIDYDGTLLYHYSVQDFLQLTQMPENPTHEGLISQGWNWSIENVREQINNYNVSKFTIGQNYITSSGATEVDINITDQYYLTLCLGQVYAKGNGIFYIDWGDNSTIDSISFNKTNFTNIVTVGNYKHTYNNLGKYTVKFYLSNDDCQFYFYAGGNQYVPIFLNPDATTVSSYENINYSSIINNIRMGKNWNQTGTPSYVFCSLYNLQTITTPNSFFLFQNIFQNCYNLKCFIFPKDFGINVPGSTGLVGSSFFSSNYNLEYISFSESITKINTPLSYTSVKRYDFSHNINNINSNFIFSNNYSLKECDLSFINITTTALGSATAQTFTNCTVLKEIKLPNSVKVFPNMSGNKYIKILNINGCNNIQSCGSSYLEQVTISNNNGNIDFVNSCFSSCYKLKKVTFNASGNILFKQSLFNGCYQLRSIDCDFNGSTTVPTSCFNNCYNLKDITIPNTVTSIENSAFTGCKCITIHLRGSTPPTLATTASFNNIVSSPSSPKRTIIYVPSGSLSNYAAATNWSALVNAGWIAEE